MDLPLNTVHAGIAAQEPPSRYSAPREGRLFSAVMAGALGVLMVLILLAMATLVDSSGKMGASLLTAISLSPPPGARSPHPERARAAPKLATTPHQVAALAPKLPPHIDVNNPNKVEWPEGFIHTTHAEMAAADIGKIHSAIASGNGSGERNAGGGGNGGGDGQGGQSWYNVEWYRKPPRSVFDSYMRPGQATGRRAEIECRMIEDYHVDDCHELSEEPRGTGMARVMREAAWQFLVRPPRLNGKALIGKRVRITYYFTHDGEGGTGEAP